MPTYDYRCQECKHELESLQSITAAPLEECPKCGKNALQRLITGAKTGLHFKGTGFYITDYKNKSSASND